MTFPMPDPQTHIKSLSPLDMAATLMTITEILYSDGMVWDPDREWNAEEIELVAEQLRLIGIYAAVEEHAGEKVIA